MRNSLYRFILFFYIFVSSLLNAEIVTGKCVGVTDGDTATVLVNGNKQVKVRFWGIDAPESSQDFGQRAKQKLSSLIYGKEVKVDITSKDRYGRSIGKVYVGGIYTNLEMVKSGLAWHYVQYAPNDSEIANAEKAARASKVGLWSHANPTPPWNWRKGIGVYDNTSDKGIGKASGGKGYTGSKVAHGNSSAKSGKGQKASKTSTVRHENTTGGKYWITGSTGKTHRKGCRWYGTTQSGYYSDRGSGDNCKKCGGAGR